MIFKLSVYQLGAILLSIYFIVRIIIQFFKREVTHSVFKFLVNLAIWVGILIFAADPPLAKFITKKLGLGENLNTLIFTGFVIIFVLLYKLLNIIENIERNITEIVRQESLKILNNKKKNEEKVS